MNPADQPRPTCRAAVRNRAFVIHYLQMLAAMIVGMVVFSPLMMFVHDAGAELHALFMATSMTAGMTVWMAWRRHSVGSIVEMGLAMYLSFAVLFPAYWLGYLSEGGLMIAGHVVMLPAMLVAMLRRRAEYAH